MSLDFALLRDLLGDVAAQFDVDCLASCDSTNTQLLQRARQAAASGSVLVADQQTAGRGRRGRHWLSAPEASLCCSWLWRCEAGQDLQGISLAVGLAVVQGLQGLGVSALALKWPNDIWLQNRKLGGVLVEAFTQGERQAVVIGVGLNLRSTWQAAEQIDQPWIALDASGLALSREVVLAALLRAWQQVLGRFVGGGFASLQEDWSSFHALRGRPLQAEERGRTVLGDAGEVDAQGRLALISPQGRVFLQGSEVSVRVTDG